MSSAIVFPATSVPAVQLNEVSPWVSSPLTAREDVHEVPEPPIVVASPSIVQTRSVMASDAVIIKVIVSPVVASVESSLLEEITILSRVGSDQSMITSFPSDVVVSSAMTFPAASSPAVQLMAASPSVSSPATVYVPPQSVPAPSSAKLAIVSPAIVQTRLEIDSDATTSMVMSSSVVA